MNSPIKAILTVLLGLTARRTGQRTIAYWTKDYLNSVQDLLKFILYHSGTHPPANRVIINLISGRAIHRRRV